MTGPRSNGHTWVVAATVDLPSPQARQAFRRGTYRIPEHTKVQVEEVYCSGCRKPFEAVAEKQCEAVESRDHLIGGPTGERKKRKQPTPYPFAGTG